MIPILKDWKGLLQKDLETVGNKKDDLLKVISLCDSYSKDIRLAMDYISANQAVINQIAEHYRQVNQLLYPDVQPQNAEQAIGNLLIELDTPEKRKKQVVEVLKRLATSPGGTVSAPDVNKTLEKNGYLLKGGNPNGIISTIIYRQPGYEKVGGGVFRKKAT